MTKVVRTHDAFYLDENRYKDPKQLHLEIIKLMKLREIAANGMKIQTVLDAGCAAGEFAYVLRSQFPESKIWGFDLLPELIAKAKLEVENCVFYQGDILNEDASPVDFADVVTCTGVLSIFDSFETCISNLIRWVKPGGTVFLHSLFSNYPFDVRVQYNPSESYGSGVLESGWNIFSKESISNFLNTLISEKAIDSFTFHDFFIKRELPIQSDKVRSWTILDEHGNLQITNGLMLLQPHAILEIKKVI